MSAREEATVATQIRIASSPEDVFEYLVNLKYHYLWNPQLRKLSSSERLVLGTKYTSSNAVLGTTIRANNTVTQFTPAQALEITNTQGIVESKTLYRLQRTPGGTLVKLSSTLVIDTKAFIFTKPLLKKLAKRELQTDLQALKIAVENKLE